MAVVIPAFNEGRTIRAIAERALRQSPLVIVVDDGSTDDTAAVLEGAPVVLLRHTFNLGKAAALWDGIGVALEHGVSFVATLDADGQHQPEDLARLAAVAIANPRSIVIGARIHARHAAPRLRRMANGFADFWISWAAGYRVADSQSGSRIYPADLLRAVNVRHDRYASFTLDSEILIRAAELGFDSIAVPIATIYAENARSSHFRPVRDVWRITRMVASTLVARRMNLRGLWASLRYEARIAAPFATTAAEVVVADAEVNAQ